MSSSKRTYDTDTITLRTIYARDSGNRFISTNNTLFADGRGGTYWGSISSLTYQPAFQVINTDAGKFTAATATQCNSITIRSGSNIGLEAITDPLSTGFFIYGKSFSQLNVPGQAADGINPTNSIQAFKNGQVTPDVNFIGLNGITIRSDPQTNTLTFDGGEAKYVSTAPYAYSQINTFSSVSFGQTWSSLTAGITLQTTSPSTILRLIGVDEVNLSTVVADGAVYIGLKTVTTSNYLAMSNEVARISTTIQNTFDFETLLGVYSTSQGQYDAYILQPQISYNSTNIGLNQTEFQAFSSVTINALSTLSTTIGVEISTLFYNQKVDVSSLSSMIGSSSNMATAGLSSVGLFTSNTSNFAVGASNSLYGVISSGFSTLSTFTGLTSNLISPGFSTLGLFTSNTSNTASDGISSVGLFTSNTSNTLYAVISSGLSSVGLFTSNTSNFAVGASNVLYGVISSGLSSVGLFTSNTSNIIAPGLSSVALFTSNTSNIIAPGLSSVGLFTSNTSNILYGVISSGFSTLSTTVGLTSNLISPGFSSFSSITWQNFSTLSSYINSAQGSVTGTDISTVALFTSNTSNTIGLGLSSFSSITWQNFSTLSSYINSVQASVTISGVDISTVARFTSNTSNSLYGVISSGLSTLSTTIGLTSNLVAPGLSSFSSITWQNFSTLSSYINSAQGSVTGPNISTVAEFTSNTSNTLYGIISSGFSTLSTTVGLTSNLIAPGLSTVALFTSNTSNSLYGVISSGLSTLSTTIGLTSNTIAPGLSSFSSITWQNFSTLSSYINSAQGSVTGANISTVALFTSNTSNTLYGVISSGLSSISTTVGLTSNLIAPGLSTVALFTSNTSNTLYGVVSSGLSTLSTTVGLTSNLIAPGLSSFSSITWQNFSTLSSYINSAQGSVTGPNISTVALFTSNTSNTLYGVISSGLSSISTTVGLTSNLIAPGLSSFSSITWQNFSTLSSFIRSSQEGPTGPMGVIGYQGIQGPTGSPWPLVVQGGIVGSATVSGTSPYTFTFPTQFTTGISYLTYNLTTPSTNIITHHFLSSMQTNDTTFKISAYVSASMILTTLSCSYIAYGT